MTSIKTTEALESQLDPLAQDSKTIENQDKLLEGQENSVNPLTKTRKNEEKDIPTGFKQDYDAKSIGLSIEALALSQNQLNLHYQ